MPHRVASYLEISNELRRITDRCDGLIADLRHRQEALLRWQECVANGAPLETLEGALADILDGEPPSWAVVRRTLAEWVEVTEQVRTLWAALPAEEQRVLEPPMVRVADEDGGR